MSTTLTSTKQVPRLSLVTWALRAMLDQVRDDGVIGRAANSSIYQTLHEVGWIWITAQNLLWAVEHYFGHLLISDPTTRTMRTLFGNGNDYPSPLGRALASELANRATLVVLVWKVVDFILSKLFSWLDYYVAEPHEIAQREFEPALQQEGVETSDDEHIPRRPLGSAISSRPFRYYNKLVTSWYLFTTLSGIGHGIYDMVQQESNAAPGITPGITPAQLAQFNPYHEITPDQEETARALLYFDHVLRDLTPTTLPDDDFGLFSDVLRSLETRTDISWRVYDATRIRTHVMAAANRGRYTRGAITPEPHRLSERITALNGHWNRLELSPSKTELWENASDTVFLQPIIEQRPLDKHADLARRLDDQVSGAHDRPAFSFTPEQDVFARELYARWKINRHRTVSYLQLHPPTPMAWVPVPKSEVGVQGAWEAVSQAVPIGPGKRIASSLLADSQQWKPLFHSLALQHIPHDWQPEILQRLQESNEFMDDQRAKRRERLLKQGKYVQELKEQMGQQKEDL